MEKQTNNDSEPQLCVGAIEINCQRGNVDCNSVHPSSIQMRRRLEADISANVLSVIMLCLQGTSNQHVGHVPGRGKERTPVGTLLAVWCTSERNFVVARESSVCTWPVGHLRIFTMALA